MKLHKLPNEEWIDPTEISHVRLKYEDWSEDDEPGDQPNIFWEVELIKKAGWSTTIPCRKDQGKARALADEIAAIINAAHEASGDCLISMASCPALPALFKANCSTGEVSRVPPHQQRVYEEKGDLDAKIRGLASFIESHPIFPQLPEDERNRMMNQRGVMSRYSAILSERIAAF